MNPESNTAPEATEEEDVDVSGQLEQVRNEIRAVCQETGRDPNDIRLVAVSKTKPLGLLQKAYDDSGQRVFGENYAQELVDKAQTMERTNVIWHFIGALQSNKANMLVKGVVPHGTLVVETVGSVKVANKLNNAMEQDGIANNHEPLAIFVQVNTSGEVAKSGVSPEEAIELCRHILQNCPRLKLRGLMTIGAIGEVSDFETLQKCRDAVAESLQVDASSLELSMGMSGDFQQAIRYGATNVRVGSTIFGAREYPNKQE